MLQKHAWASWNCAKPRLNKQAYYCFILTRLSSRLLEEKKYVRSGEINWILPLILVVKGATFSHNLLFCNYGVLVYRSSRYYSRGWNNTICRLLPFFFSRFNLVNEALMSITFFKRKYAFCCKREKIFQRSGKMPENQPQNQRKAVRQKRFWVKMNYQRRAKTGYENDHFFMPSFNAAPMPRWNYRIGSTGNLPRCKIMSNNFVSELGRHQFAAVKTYFLFS